MDRIGAAKALRIGASATAGADAIGYAARSITLFDLSAVLAGIAFTLISIATPTLVIGATNGNLRTRARSIW